MKRRVMKIIVMIIFFLNSSILCAFSQNTGSIVSQYLKRVEHNMIMLEAVYNLKSKGDVEKLLLPDFNAPVEFFSKPDRDGIVFSIRIVKGSSFWNLEIKYITNFFVVNRSLADKFPEITENSSSFSSLPTPSADEVRKHNDAVRAKRTEESLMLYIVDTLSFPIGNQLAEQLYEKMVSLIVNFKAKGFPRTCLGCYTTSFRTVIDDEVWSLWIHAPEGNALKMADLFGQIITDAIANELNEAEYINVLNSFEY